ncbi:hypothetical protein JXA84_08505 [candidate division WOR-3 bacterium]|nr:hypothetical protein [candidate division WOR-3 bacterium]
MSQEKISNSIIEEAEKKAESILTESDLKVTEIKSRGKKEVEKIRREQEEMIKQLSEREKDKHISLAQLQMNLEKLSVKRSEIDRVFEESLKIVLKRDDAYKQRFKKAILAAARTGNETIFVNEEDRKLLSKNFVKELNDAFGKKADFKVSSETAKIKGGALLQEGKITTDASFETILSEDRYFLETDTSQILCGESS